MTMTVPEEQELLVPLHSREALRRTWFNRLFALLYGLAILALMYHHVLNIMSHDYSSVFSVVMFVADGVLAFLWATYTGFRLRPIRRRVFPETLGRGKAAESEYPGLDVLICTADPYKEPPVSVVNTALSVMAYDYPTEKLSVYLSDDGGSELTLFAFVEAAKFARHWLPFCKKNNVLERSPEAYFSSYHPTASSPDTDNIKLMYERMKMKVENVVERGSVSRDYINSEEELQVFGKHWIDGFTRQDHPPVIQVLLNGCMDKDVTGRSMPNLVYVSREKNRTTPHNFKAGALNALVVLRVSAAMTNAPLVLNVDCDMRSNDPKTPLRALCYFVGPSAVPHLAFLQFPQLFHGINKNDIYGAEFKFGFQIDPAGMDGFAGPIHNGTGCFFRRRAFFGSPLSFVSPEIPELSPYHVPVLHIQSKDVLGLAHHLAGCNYEAQTKWGSEMGFRYGTLVEDLYTGYRLQCEGWRSNFCHPQRPAFLGEAPRTLLDLLNQTRRWGIGFLDVAFCKYSPVTHGVRSLNLFHAFCYIHYSFWALWSIPVTIYAFLPQLALLNSFPIFPKISDPWFLLYAFLFLGAYAQECLEFMLGGGTFQGWWNHQRAWTVRGLSSFLFGLVEYFLKSLGISTLGFDVTSKVVDDETGKRYDQGIFEFGVASPMFLPAATAAIINLVSFFGGIVGVFKNGSCEDMFLQMFLAAYGVVNGWPFYEAMVLRTDKGRMPLQITLTSTFLAWVLFVASSFSF